MRKTEPLDGGSPALRKFPVVSPFLTAFALLLIALAFRLTDIFVLRLDERWGEILLSKALGFALVVAFVWLTGHTLQSIGLHSRLLPQSLLIGTLITTVAFLLGYGAELITPVQSGSLPVLRLSAIDPKAGVAGGVLFAFWLVAGNFVNSWMEEGLFRGIMIRLFRIRLSFWQANLLQAFLFGLWHLPWVLKWYQTGQVTTGSEIAFAMLSNFLPQFVMGIVWGYLYLKTDNLWTVWIAHTLTNSTLNLLHVVTVEGMDVGMTIRMLVYMLAALLSLYPMKYLIQRFQMPEVAAWDAPENQR